MTQDEWPPEESNPLEERLAEGPRERYVKEMMAGATEQLLAENAEFSEQATIDQLTGIDNRRGFIAKLETATAPLFAPEGSERRKGTRQAPEHITIAFLDIDHFKKFNDEYGHQVGDEVLKAVAEHLASVGRAEDIVARWGGEEFIIAFRGADERAILEKFGMNRKEHRPAEISIPAVRIGDREFHVTISGGLAAFEPKGTFPEALEAAQEKADEALYAAKGSGRNRVLSLTERLPID